MTLNQFLQARRMNRALPLAQAKVVWSVLSVKITSNYMHVVSVILKVVCVILKAVFIDHSEGCLDFCGYRYTLY